VVDLKKRGILVEMLVPNTSFGYEVDLGAPGLFEVLHPRRACSAHWMLKDLRTFLVALVTAAGTAYVLKVLKLP